MFDSTQFTKAALILGEAQREIEKLIGVKILLEFEIDPHKQVTPRDVIKIVANLTNSSVLDLLDRIKTDHICYARYACYYIMRTYLKMTYEQIGEAMEKNHSTVMAGLRVLNDQKKNRVLQLIVKESEEAFIKWMGK